MDSDFEFEKLVITQSLRYESVDHRNTACKRETIADALGKISEGPMEKAGKKEF